jgi:hypothetical protein
VPRPSVVATYSGADSPRRRWPQRPGSALWRRADGGRFGNDPRPGKVFGLITHGPAAVRGGKMHVLDADDFDEVEVDDAAAALER